jgi:tetratricopeptide (TPR) repeat protein
MKRKSSNLNWRRIALIYAAVALSATLLHDWFIDGRMLEVRQTLHEQVMAGQAPAPIQYRILVYWAADGLLHCGIPFRAVYGLLRFLFIFLSAGAFHCLLSLWFTPAACIIGVLYLLAVLPLTFIRYYMQPMDLSNLFFFLAGSILIARRRDFLLVPLLFVAMLNRETAILLVLVYLLFRYDELKPGTLALRAGLLFATGMGAYAGLRKLFSIKQIYADLYYLDTNLADPLTYLYALALFGPFLFLAWQRWKEQPKFLRRALLFVPFFAVIHFTMTIMVEARLWLPVLPFLVASGLWVLLPDEMKLPQEPAPPGRVRNFVTRYPKLGYASLFGAFMVFFLFFFAYYKDLHLKDRSRMKLAESLLYEGKAYARNGWNAEALAAMNKALVYRPDDENLHYEIAVLYDFSLHDHRSAVAHYERCLALDPYFPQRDRVKNEIDRLKYCMERKL